MVEGKENESLLLCEGISVGISWSILMEVEQSFDADDVVKVSRAFSHVL